MIASTGTLMRTLFAVGLLLCFPGTTFAFQDDSIVEQFGRMLGGALRGEQFAEPVIERMDVIEVDAGEGEKIPAGELEEFKGRITAYSNAMFAWVVRVCEIPESDQARVREIFDAAVQKQCESFEKRGRRNPQFAQEMFPKTTPVLFTQKQSPAQKHQESVLKELREKILSEPQKTRLDEAVKERNAARLQAFAGYMVMIVDRELYLTDPQRIQLTEKIVNARKPLEHTFYSFHPQSYYLPYEGMSLLLSRVSAKEIFEPAQRKRLTDLSDSDTNNSVSFQASDGIEAWHQQMNEMAKAQRNICLRAAAVRVAWMQKELQLTPEQVTTLTHASQGAVVRAIGDWKEQTQQTLDQMEQQMAQMGGNFGFGAQSINGSDIDRNPIWMDTLKSISEGKAADRLKQRKKQQADAISLYLIAMFDDELWLSPSQRAELHPVFLKAMPASEDQLQHYEYIRDIIWVAYPLFKTGKKEREAILTESQKGAWEQMESCFDYQKSNNYVQIQMRNHGGSFGFILND